MSDESNALQPGSTFGKHRIVRLLGRGGMGEVYEVTDEAGISWALKVLASDMMDKPGAVERFRREALVMSEMDHPGIVKVDRMGESKGRHWLRMEMAEGREVEGKRAITLQDYVEASEGRLSETETKELLQSLLTSLEYAHGRGLVHRDLKPANVLFFGDEPKIADFGLVDAAGAEWMETQVKNSMVASMMEATLLDSDTGSTGSRSRALMGTFAYMSPEQKEGLEADARSDLYAIGLMAREAITGVKSLGMERPTEMACDIHAGWDDWVRRAVANDAEHRFQSAGEMRSALIFPKAKRSSSPIPLIVLGLAAVVAAVYFVIGDPFVENPNASEDDTTSKGTPPEEATQDKEKTEGELTGLAAGASGLRLTIDPPNVPAKIWITGQASQEVVGGKKSFEELKPGAEELVVKAEGFQDYSVRLRLVEGWNSHRVGLVALSGGLIVRSDPGVEVLVVGSDGRKFDLGVTDSLGVIESEGILAVGTYEVRLSKPLRIPVSHNVRLMVGKSVTLEESLAAEPGKLFITASPAGVMIALNGVPKGAVPLELDTVPAEKDWKVTARLEGYRELSKTIRLDAAGSQTIEFGALVKEWGSLVVKLRADLAEDSATKMFLQDLDVTAKVKRDSPGLFAVEGLSVGAHVVKVTHPDFYPWSGSIEVRDAEKTERKAKLDPKDAELLLEVLSNNAKLGLLKDFSLFSEVNEILPQGGAYSMPAEKETVLEIKAEGHRSRKETLRFKANEKRISKIVLEQISAPVKGKSFILESSRLPMIWVNQGTFQMGSPSGEIVKGKAIGREAGRDKDEASHTVTLTKGFWLGRHEVTQGQWERVMGSNPSEFKGADRPVEKVSWNDAVAFCKKLTGTEMRAGRLPAGMAYQLPTEAQWEYACRAGTMTTFSFGESLTSEQANISGGPGETTPVGKYPANPWGFHDMHGNVWEWCADRYGDYPSGVVRDPVGSAIGSHRVSRGGSWHYPALTARCANRESDGSGYSFNMLGFRLSLRAVRQ
jgi:formylglycine-generating enzyme required for sulfatase activity/tRNA A-37 threonylcarbamoyl transferase component Bud32